MLLCSFFDLCYGQNLTAVEQAPPLQLHENASRRLSGHAYISLNKLEQSDGTNEIEEGNGALSLKARTTKSDRPKKILLRASEQTADNVHSSQQSQKTPHSTTSYQSSTPKSSFKSKSKMVRGANSKPKGSLKTQQNDNGEISTVAPASNSTLRGVGLPKHPTVNEQYKQTVTNEATPAIKANSIDFESNRDANRPSPIQPKLITTEQTELQESMTAKSEASKLKIRPTSADLKLSSSKSGRTSLVDGAPREGFYTDGSSFVSILIQTQPTHASTSSPKEKSRPYGIIDRSDTISSVNEESERIHIKNPQLYHESIGSIGEETVDGYTTSNFSGGESFVSVLMKTKNKHRSHSIVEEKSKAGRFKSYVKSNKKSHKSSRSNRVDQLHGTGASSTSEYYEDNEKVDGWLTSQTGKSSKGSKSSKSKNQSHESTSKRTKMSKGREKKRSSSKTASVPQRIVSPYPPVRPVFVPTIQETEAPAGSPSAQPVVSPSKTPTTLPSRFAPVPSVAPIVLPSVTATPTASGVADFPSLAPSNMSAFTSTPTTVGSTLAPTSNSVTMSPTATPTVVNVPTNAPSSVQTSSAPVGIPTISPVMQETQAPIVSTSVAPNAEPSVAEPSIAPAVGKVDASPFNVVYEAGGQPSESDLLSAGALTVQYLEDFFASQFALNSNTELVATTGTVTSTDATQSLVTFDLTLTFSDGSVFVPSSSDVDNLLFAAFQLPFVDSLLTLLTTDLSSDNALSTTSSVQYSKSGR